MRIAAVSTLVGAALCGCHGQSQSSGPPGEVRCQDYQPLKNVYFGDLHVHTSYSFDAYDYGNRTDPSSAYAFARGAGVDVAPTGDPNQGQSRGPLGVKIDFSGKKLDFMAVTDHAEFLGSMQGCTVDPSSGFYDAAYCQALRDAVYPDFQDTTSPSYVLKSPCVGRIGNGGTSDQCTQETTLAWAAEQQATTAANEPCAFTTLHGFEWSAVGLAANPQPTLHRNVLFATDHVVALPLDFVTYRSETSLWNALDEQCTAANQCEAITIPHNSNRSQGLMFDISAYGPAELQHAVHYQRLVEIHQSKGNSECLTDTADNGAVTPCDLELETGDTDPAFAPGYVRPALERGLAAYADGGVDPLQLGFVGSTDTHNATPGNVAEGSWPGHHGVLDNTYALRLGSGIAGQNPGGLTGVWAEQNTRDAIWAALQRREVFATSGPRIVVRLYEFSAGDPCNDPGFPAKIVAAGAVPMGGTMTKLASAPSFVVYALPDAEPLVDVDVVKGSQLGASTVERVYSLPLANAPYCVTWTDPDFQPASPSFYYARVKEAATARWSHYDCEQAKAQNPTTWQTQWPGCQPGGNLDTTIQERAWTSPIWYLPM